MDLEKCFEEIIQHIFQPLLLLIITSHKRMNSLRRYTLYYYVQLSTINVHVCNYNK